MSSSKPQFCKRGHDTFICGRYSDGICKQCMRDHQKKYYDDNRTKILEKKKAYDHSHKKIGKSVERAEKMAIRQKKYYEEHKEEIAAKRKKRYEANKEIILARNKEYYETHKEEISARKAKQNELHKEEKAEYNIKYYNENKEIILVKNKEWRDANPGVVKAGKIANSTNRNLRIVAWTDWDSIIKIYSNCPKDKQVDHVIPLCGAKISGLHVSWNLQYLTPRQNRSKRNKVNLIEVSKWYGKILDEAGLKQ